jgi:hypothetical protein
VASILLHEGPTLLDEILPMYDVASRHSIRIDATSGRVYQAVRTVDLGRPWVIRVLMGMRSVPARAAAMLGVGGSRARERPPRRAVQGLAFTVIAEAPDEELVLGLLGRFWTSSGGVIPAGPDRFRLPPPPGLAQAVWNFRVEPEGIGTRLSTETRVRCADPATRRHFLRYWRVVQLGSGLTRRSMLRLIRRTAERGDE